jgi:hypothetical protein
MSYISWESGEYDCIRERPFGIDKRLDNGRVIYRIIGRYYREEQRTGAGWPIFGGERV